MPETSIIVPVYKVEPYLKRCVDSILAQLYTDFELILVNDGSPDRCGLICDELAKTDSRIRVIHKANGGLSSARNAGLRIAQGNYIMFCDSDDYVDPKWCSVHIGLIKSFPSAFVVTNMYRLSNTSLDPLCSLEFPSGSDYNYFSLYKMGLSGFSVNKIYNAHILRSHAIEFDEKCRFAEDVAFTTAYFKYCSEIRYDQTPLYYYYQNESGILHSYYPNLFEYRIPTFDLRVPLISEADLGDFCDIWLYQFIVLFDNVFHSKNKMSFFKKIRYNQKMIKTKEFRYCLDHASGNKEHPRVIRILKHQNYYLFWLYNLIINHNTKGRRKL